MEEISNEEMLIRMKLLDSYYKLFFYKLLSEDYVCLKNIMEKIIKTKLLPKYPENLKRDETSKTINAILQNSKSKEKKEINRKMEEYEMMSLVYADFRKEDIVGQALENNAKKAVHIKKVFEKNKNYFIDKYIGEQKDKYEIRSFGYPEADLDVTLDDENEYLFFLERISINRIESLDACQRIVKEIKKNSINHLFFRGHSDSNYLIEPSITRSKNLLKNESKLYEEMLIKNPQEFENISIHLNILKKMQHYGLPTRLMDITQNILIALYFATEVNDDIDGEVIIFSEENIKYTRSDNVTVLSSLAFCNHKMKKNILIRANGKNDNEIKTFNNNVNLKKLLHEITAEKNFLPEIKPSTFQNNYFVLPTMDNERITRQSGCFIISALNKEKGKDINESRVEIDEKKVIYIIPHGKKKKLRQELDNFGINRSFVYPEISEVATYLKSKY